jgi:hypothetical protein
MQFSKGANDSHAIEFGTNSPLSMTLTDIAFSGYGATNNANDSHFHIKRTSGTVTINLSGCTSGTTGFSYRTDGATVVLVLDQADFSFTVSPSITGYEWRLYEDSATPGVIGTVALAGQETATQDNQSYTYTYTADKDVALQIIATGYEESVTYHTLGINDQDLTINLSPEENT